MNLEYLDPPQLVVLSETEGRDERRVSNWITEWDFEEEIDVGIIGVPMDTSTMVDSVLTETPNNIRKASAKKPITKLWATNLTTWRTNMVPQPARSPFVVIAWMPRHCLPGVCPLPSTINHQLR